MLIYIPLSLESGTFSFLAGGGVLFGVLFFIADFCLEPFFYLAHNKDLQKI